MNNPAKIKTSTPAALVANVMYLVSLPEVYLRLQKVLDDPHHTRDDLGSSDSGLGTIAETQRIDLFPPSSPVGE